MPPSGEVSVPAEGGLVFQATINGIGPFKAGFDTGAGVSILSTNLARKLGLTLDTQASELGTSSPANVQVHKTHIDTLQIGDPLLHDQALYVIDFPGGVDDSGFLVGYELLRRFAVKIDFEQQRLTFYDGPRFHYSGPGTAVPLRKVYFEATKESAQPEVFNRAGLIFDSFGHGLEVMTVLPGSPGAQAAIETGDVITAIDGKTPSDEENQPAFLQPAGTQVELTVRHGTETRKVTVILRDVI